MSAVKKFGLGILILLVTALMIGCADPSTQQEDGEEELPEETAVLDERIGIFEEQYELASRNRNNDQDKLPSSSSSSGSGPSMKHEVTIKTDGTVTEGKGDGWWKTERGSTGSGSSGWWQN